MINQKFTIMMRIEPSVPFLNNRFFLITCILFSMLNAEYVYGQSDEKTFELFGPVELKFEPTLTFENLGKQARILSQTGSSAPETIQTSSEAVFELALAFGIPTFIPRVDLTFETIWKPFATTSENLFTGETSNVLGSEINDNLPEIEAEINFSLFTFEETNGWVGAHFDVIDKYSPAKRPDDNKLYTHKLNLELDVAFAIFKWLKNESWLSKLELEGSLDYMATGIPKKGDTFPELGIQYLDDASPWSFSALLVLPLAPLHIKSKK